MRKKINVSAKAAFIAPAFPWSLHIHANVLILGAPLPDCFGSVREEGHTSASKRGLGRQSYSPPQMSRTQSRMNGERHPSRRPSKMT